MVREIEVIIADLNQIHANHFDDWYGYSELIRLELEIFERLKPHKEIIYRHFYELIPTYEELAKVNKSYS